MVCDLIISFTSNVQLEEVSIMVSTNFKITINCFFSYFRFSLKESNHVRESQVLVTTNSGSTTSAISSKISEINENTINGCCATTSRYG